MHPYLRQRLVSLARRGGYDSGDPLGNAMQAGSQYLQGGVPGMLSSMGYQVPGWVQSIGRFVNNPDFNAAMGVTVPSGAPYKGLQDLRDYWTGKGVRNFVSDRPSQNQLYLDDLVVPPEQRGTGVGSGFMKDLTGFADSQKKDVALTAAKDYGTTSLKRLKDFYRQFGFVENKGRNYDPSISGNMYRRFIDNR